MGIGMGGWLHKYRCAGLMVINEVRNIRFVAILTVKRYTGFFTYHVVTHEVAFTAQSVGGTTSTVIDAHHALTNLHTTKSAKRVKQTGRCKHTARSAKLSVLKNSWARYNLNPLSQTYEPILELHVFVALMITLLLRSQTNQIPLLIPQPQPLLMPNSFSGISFFNERLVLHSIFVHVHAKPH